jgi:hypothetical protein
MDVFKRLGCFRRAATTFRAVQVEAVGRYLLITSRNSRCRRIGASSTMAEAAPRPCGIARPGLQVLAAHAIGRLLVPHARG